MSNGKKRLLKTVSWSLIALGVTTGVGWIATGSLIKGGAIGLICRLIKVPAYWAHDAAWDRVPVVEVTAEDVAEANQRALDGMLDLGLVPMDKPFTLAS